MAILVVDDEPVVRLTLVDFLNDAGFNVLDAGDAADALAIIRGSAEGIDILVTDLNLGPGDNGLVLVSKARLQVPDLSVVYVTGSPEMFREYAFAPGDRVFLKPFDPNALVAAVAALDQATRPRRLQPCSAEAATALSL